MFGQFNTKAILSLQIGTNDICLNKKPNKNEFALIERLLLLPCFASCSVTEIKIFEAGLSQPCFQVKYQGRYYAAKCIADNKGELAANILASEQGIAANIFYSDAHWLINEFLPGNSLDDSLMCQNDKMGIMVKLLAQCHGIDYTSSAKVKSFRLVKLSINDLLFNLLNKVQLPRASYQALKTVITYEQSRLTDVIKVTNSQNVFCHGDANFTNAIAVSKTLANGKNNHETAFKLIDFDSACIAPIEYDLAMLLAVNEFEAEHIRLITSLYYQQQLAQNWALSQREKQKNIETTTAANTRSFYGNEIVDNLADNTQTSMNSHMFLVTRYYSLSLIINGLWYLSYYQLNKGVSYQKRAVKQFSLLKKQHPKTQIVIDEMR